MMYTDERYSPSNSVITRSMLYHVLYMGNTTFDESFRIDRKFAPSILFTYTKSGCGILEYRGHRYEVGEGTFMLIHCCEPQLYYTKPGCHWEQSWLHFYGSESDAYYNAIYQAAGPVQSIPSNENLLAYMEKLISLKRNNDLEFEIRASSLIVQLLTDMLLISKRTTTRQMNSFVTKTITEIIDEMDKNIGQSFSVADMAKHACMSQSHFTTLFKQVMGIPPYEYLLRRRIETAKGLLSGTDHLISEIAQRVGFYSASHFIRTFHKYETISPSRYRNIFLHL